MTQFAKPRLKLRLDGSVQILKAAPLGWSCYAAGDFIRMHYGTRTAFALRWHLHYGALCEALAGDHASARRAGLVGEYRQLLGLRSEPSQASRRASLSYYRARGMQVPRTLRAGS